MTDAGLAHRGRWRPALASLAGLALALSLALTAAGLQAEPASPYSAAFPRRPTAAELAALGAQLFHEAGLSASGRQSCASCHSPAQAFGPPNAQAVQRGGASGRLPGLRAAPSLRYRASTPAYSDHQRDSDGNDADDQGPAGGWGWDGRFDSAQAQAAAPLLSPFEMANASPEAAVQRLAASRSAAAFETAFGPGVLQQPDLAWLGLRWALEVYQQQPETFAPFSSRYDAVLRGQTRLSAAETRGLQLFRDPAKGNCTSCHSADARRGALPLFTDFGLVALGVPDRHGAAPDQGLCGPLRSDHAADPEVCGRFKTPSLRNVASRRVFMHNGALQSLDEVLRFYVWRDLDPRRVRPAGGPPLRWPAAVPALETGPPFEPLRDARGRLRPRLTAAELADLKAFLQTLSDADLRPAARSAPPPPPRAPAAWAARPPAPAAPARSPRPAAG